MNDLVKCASGAVHKLFNAIFGILLSFLRLRNSLCQYLQHGEYNASMKSPAVVVRDVIYEQPIILSARFVILSHTLYRPLCKAHI